MVAITELLEGEIARLKTLPNDEQDAIALFPPTATKPEPLALRLNPLPAVGESHFVGFALLRDRQYAANRCFCCGCRSAKAFHPGTKVTGMKGFCTF